VPLAAGWAFVGNWTYNDTKTITGEPRLRRPRDLGNLGIQYTSEGSGLQLLANYRISRDAIDFGNTPLDDYEVLDLSLGYTFKKGLETYGRIENALDEEYVEVLGYNTAGRAVYGGVRFHF
jgi:vitamin B12 transporter